MNQKRTIKEALLLLPGSRQIIQDRDRLLAELHEDRATIKSLTLQNQRALKKIDDLEVGKNDAYYYATDPQYYIDEQDIAKSKQATAASLHSVRTANWLIPNFQHLAFGGLFTIFRFIEKLSVEGVENRIIIYGRKQPDLVAIERDVHANFPKLKGHQFIPYNPHAQTPDSLPACDIAFCTLWNSAYALLKFNKTKRKYYFIQDYEPLFMPAGSVAALAESTYRFGFKSIVNTPGLLEFIQGRHHVEGISFMPGIDKEVYHPGHPKSAGNHKLKIFFYGRPDKPRNGFELGLATIQLLLEANRGAIEVVTAGATWNPADYGLTGNIRNLGLLHSVQEVAELYRSCDIGFYFMLTRHPSYQPLEFMASGMAAVTNSNEDNEWFIKHDVNCLVSEPSPKAMAEAIQKLIDDRSLRQRLVRGGYESTQDLTWARELELLWKKVRKW